MYFYASQKLEKRLFLIYKINFSAQLTHKAGKGAPVWPARPLLISRIYSSATSMAARSTQRGLLASSTRESSASPPFSMQGYSTAA